MSTSQLIDRLAVLIALVALAAGALGHAPVIGGAIFWTALLGGWLLKRWDRERQTHDGGDDGRTDAGEGRHRRSDR